MEQTQGDPLFADLLRYLMHQPDVVPPPDFKEAKLEHSPIVLMAHPKKKCKGRPCALHRRTDHRMRSFMQHWRDDRGLMERICPHGAGHPDWDSYSYYYEKYGKQHADVEFVHGCCGERCCQPPPDWFIEKYRQAD